MTSPEGARAINLFKEAKAESQSATNADEYRVWYEGFTAQFDVPEEASVEQVGVGGVTAEWVSAPGASEKKAVLYLHGGGYMIGSARTHRVPMVHLSKASVTRVLGLNFRLAPEHPFPAAVEDSLTAYRWLLEQGILPRNIVLGGDSAGGGLTLATLVALRYMGDPMPAAGISHSGWTDLANTGETFVTKAEEDPLIDKEMVDNMAAAYLGDRSPTIPWRLLTMRTCATCRRC